MALNLTEITTDIDEIVEIIATGEKGTVGEIRFECIDGEVVAIAEVYIVYPEEKGYRDLRLDEIQQATHLGP